MKIAEIIQTIEDFAPISYQESYDNAGLLIGDKLADKLPISLIHKIGAAIFLVVGISTLVQHYFF